MGWVGEGEVLHSMMVMNVMPTEGTVGCGGDGVDDDDDGDDDCAADDDDDDDNGNGDGIVPLCCTKTGSLGNGAPGYLVQPPTYHVPFLPMVKQ